MNPPPPATTTTSPLMCSPPNRSDHDRTATKVSRSRRLCQKVGTGVRRRKFPEASKGRPRGPEALKGRLRGQQKAAGRAPLEARCLAEVTRAIAPDVRS